MPGKKPPKSLNKQKKQVLIKSDESKITSELPKRKKLAGIAAAEIAKHFRKPTNPVLKYYEYKIAQALFPEHTIKVTAGEIKRRAWQFWRKKAILYSKYYSTDSLYQKYVEFFYSHKDPNKIFSSFLHKAHRKRVRSKKVDRLLKEMNKAGIDIDTQPINVGFCEGKPIFFEINYINPNKAKEYALSHLKGKKLKQVLNWIERLKIQWKKTKK